MSSNPKSVILFISFLLNSNILPHYSLIRDSLWWLNSFFDTFASDNSKIVVGSVDRLYEKSEKEHGNDEEGMQMKRRGGHLWPSMAVVFKANERTRFPFHFQIQQFHCMCDSLTWTLTFFVSVELEQWPFQGVYVLYRTNQLPLNIVLFLFFRKTSGKESQCLLIYIHIFQW